MTHAMTGHSGGIIADSAACISHCKSRIRWGIAKERNGGVEDHDAQALRPGGKAPRRPRLRTRGCNVEPVLAGAFCLGAVNVCNGTGRRAGASVSFRRCDTFAPGGTQFAAFGARGSEGISF